MTACKVVFLLPILPSGVLMKSGYIIANQHEEFVASFDIQSGYVSLTWSPSPALAHVFVSQSKCRKIMKALADPKYDLWEMILYETASKYVVACTCSVLPPWYHQDNKSNNRNVLPLRDLLQ